VRQRVFVAAGRTHFRSSAGCGSPGTRCGFLRFGSGHRVFAMVEVVKTQIVIVRVSELDVIETEKLKE
jgi:hypothetical protein